MTARPAPWTPPRPLPARHETPRIVIRYWEPEDAAGMLAALEVGRGPLLPWLPWVEVDNRTVAECVDNIERFRRTREDTTATPTDFVVGLFDRSTGEAIGGTGFHRLDLGGASAEIGYWVRSDRHGQGLATEATAAMITWGFTAQESGGWGLRRIEVRCAGQNVASRRVPEKLGMRREMTLVAERFVDGIGYDDTLGYALLSSEWNAALQRRGG